MWVRVPPSAPKLDMLWLIIVLVYFLGAIPTAYIVGRFKGEDIRQIGDGNVGAANAFRQLGAKIGTAVFFIDAGKGVLAVLIAHRQSVCLRGLSCSPM
ncbi:glycerol-3-phosphate acyltransferase [Chloroflexota bacterium]